MIYEFRITTTNGEQFTYGTKGFDKADAMLNAIKRFINEERRGDIDTVNYITR